MATTNNKTVLLSNSTKFYKVNKDSNYVSLDTRIAEIKRKSHKDLIELNRKLNDKKTKNRLTVKDFYYISDKLNEKWERRNRSYNRQLSKDLKEERLDSYQKLIPQSSDILSEMNLNDDVIFIEDLISSFIAAYEAINLNSYALAFVSLKCMLSALECGSVS